MDKENILYLFNLAKRAEYFDTVRKDTIKYIFEHTISEQQLRIELVVMSAMWAAKKLNTHLNKHDLEMFFNVDTHDENKEEIFNLELLDPTKEQVTHTELMDMIVESSNTI
jgi:hypothetical protein